MTSSRQRKQKLATRVESPPSLSRDVDPFLAGPTLPYIPELGIEGLNQDTSMDDFSALSYLSADDLGPMSTLFEGIGDSGWNPGSSLEGSPCNLAQDTFGKEMFQDLRHTSTPKGTSTLEGDSGIGDSRQISSSRKKIKFGEENEESKPFTVLHDITGENSLSRRSSDSLTNLADMSMGSENNGRRVSIIRKNIVKRRKIGALGLRWGVEDKERILYYTGIKQYEVASFLLTRHSPYVIEGMQSNQAEILTFMQLRHNLEWEDLSFRFDAPSDVVGKVFCHVLEKLATYLLDTLPWHSKRVTCKRTLPKLLYFHPIIFKNSVLRQLFVCVSDDKSSPVLYVSKPYPEGTEVFDFIEAELGRRLVDGDVLVTSSAGGQLRYYNLQDECIIPSDQSRHLNAMTRASNILNELKQFKMFSAKFRVTDVNITHIVTIIAAIVNLNNSSKPTLQPFRL